MSDIPLIINKEIAEGKITWRSPSNIALIKYWGKHGNQLPRNPSISFTLTNAFTETTLAYRQKTALDDSVSLKFRFEGQENQTFENRLIDYLNRLSVDMPFIRQLDLEVFSRNSFPHSAGIASSASAMSALALCLCTLEDKLFQSLSDDSKFEEKASVIARLGSGSACRSIFSYAALWGKTGIVHGASDQYAIPFGKNLHQVFKSYYDAILIVDQENKKVSSSEGHQLMDGNPFSKARYEEAKRHLNELAPVLQSGDVDRFSTIVEAEAMQLHALMMCSSPSYILMKPDALKIIELVKEFRKTTSVPLCFTLDAGPNVHLLYPQSDRQTVRTFIEQVLTPYCFQGRWIDDLIGEGPIQID